MRKKILIIILLGGLASCTKKPKETVVAEQQVVANDLPTMQVNLLDGTKVDLKKIKESVVLILFQPDCDHCQREAGQIQANLASFKNYTLYFISSAEFSQVQKFANDYKLLNASNVKFGLTTTTNILDNFGPIQAPSVYIYNQGKLVHQFSGEVDVHVMLNYI